MKIYRQSAEFMSVLALTFALVLAPGFIGTVKAASEDVAMFYDDLSQYGQWVDYEKYGPVWRPNQVAEDWRPYTNGRWVPTNDGNVFESEEPWGWATYHYGNWMPTEGYGWVWVPGSTWYPSTVEWRSSPENEPVEDSYVGWAPTPPPNYEPPPDYAPPSYYQGAPVTDSLASPLWIFAQAASFLLGFGQSYTPAYSYVNSGILVPPSYVPVFYNQTVVINRYVTPAYYPPNFAGVRRFGGGAYNMGPSVGYLSRVTRINRAVINRNIHNNSIHLNRIHNVMPPERVMRRDGYINKIMPPALVRGQPLPAPHPINNMRLAQANLNRPNFLPPPHGVPQINTRIPRVQPVAVAPGRGLAGMALPAKATMPLSPHMTQQIHQLPPRQQFIPGTSQPFKPAAATPPGQLPSQSGNPARPGPGQGVVPGQPGQGHRQPAVQTKPGQFQPGAQTKPGRVQPGVQTQPATPSGPVRRGELHPGSPRPGAPPAGTFTRPGATQPSPAPLPQGYRGLTLEQRRQQEQEHQRLQRGRTPGQPSQHQQEQPNQVRQRQQQLQQQQRQQQDHQRQQQLQQRQRQRQPQDLQRQQQQRQVQPRQLQDRQRQQPRPIQARPQPRVQPRPQPQVAPRSQPRQQQRQPEKTKREQQQ